LRVLDLFSGIGGFSLGLERAGMRTVAFCEIQPYPRAVLAMRWPGVPIYEDVRALTSERLAADGIAVDVICGGFPCQDISNVGKRAGLAGERSGLWREYARLIDELRPNFVIVENVAALLERGIERVLGDLAACGYDAEWDVLPAGRFGAPHIRNRLYLVAYPQGNPKQGSYLSRPRISLPHFRLRKPGGGFGLDVPGSCWEEAQPEFSEVDDGIPGWMGEVSGYGNAVVPAVVEAIGRAILNDA
jgi:DNA (cytosine-5)-methyltransferase 1